MKRTLVPGLFVIFAAALSAQTLELPANLTPIFEDQFDRAEADDSKEQIGNDWLSNSARRAKGDKQGDLKDGVLSITMSPRADHGVSIKHTAPFDDGVIQVRFRMKDAKGIGFNFNDPSCKVSHAGHICALGVKPKRIMFRDGKTGVFDLAFRKKKEAGLSKPEQNAFLKNKFHYEDVQLNLNEWYELTIIIQGASMKGFINGKPVGELSSPGIDHNPKANLAFAVSGQADVDWVKISRIGK